MHVGDDGLVTQQMVAVFVLCAAEVIPVVVILGAVGVLPVLVSSLVVGGILALFAVWILVRWRRLQTDDDALERDPVETLKQRYAAGELSDAEFEQKLERLIDTPDEDADWHSTRTDGEIRASDSSSTRNGGASEHVRESN